MQRASSHPNTMFGVIVQKATKDKGIEAEVTHLGGKVTKDLSIVNGFAAQLTGAAIQALAREDGVSWISSDGNMNNSSGPSMFTTWATDFGNMPSTQKSDSFNNTAIASGRYIWFDSTI